MGQIFSIDSKFFVFMTKVADLFALNILFVICCIPIITIGASVSAMYSITMKMAKNEEVYIFKSFFEVFKQNFKCATITWVICILVGIVLWVDITFAISITGGLFSMVFKIIIYSLVLALLITFTYIFPMMSKFENSINNYLKNSFLMAAKHFLRTIIILIINSIPCVCVILGSYFFAYGVPIYLMIGFAVSALANSLMFNSIFKIYEQN